MHAQQYRIFDSKTQYEARESDVGVLEGYASVFNKPSVDMGGLTEYIHPSAFEGTDMSDVRALFNHKSDNMLGRTTSGTLEVGVDDKGLWYRVQLPNTTLGKDIAELVKRGDIKQSSFGFTIEEAGWEVKDGEEVFVIRKIGKLFDVSPVTFPAYPDTSVEARSIAGFIETAKMQKSSADGNSGFPVCIAERQLILMDKNTL